MKTIYSRFQNLAAGKFVATQEDMEADDYNPEDWSNINDIEKALQTIGIQVRKSASEFRDFDDVLSDLAETWDSLSSVQQAGAATSIAGKIARNYRNIVYCFIIILFNIIT